MADIRALNVDDLDAVLNLRAEALLAVPHAFAASPEDDRGSDPEHVRMGLSAPDRQMTYGAFDGGELVGMTVVVRESRLKMNHKVYVYAMYVRDTARGNGLGAALLDAAIAQARQWGSTTVRLSVTMKAPAARRMYERAGFVAWGTEPRSLCIDGELFDEIHMALNLS